jgi:23S rRNA pseudouridine1911/1915/1917 synthase
MSSLEPAKNIRLDQYIVELIPELSRSFGSKLIEQGKVSVNGEIITKAGFKLHSTDKIKVDFDIAELKRIPDIELPILYEDDDCVVIDKPVGVLSHSKGTFNPEATVASWLSHRFKGASGERAGIVHRLDRATSGVMICAKNPVASLWLQKQFSQRKVKKNYIAIVKGTPDPAEAIIDMPIERNPKAPATFRVGTSGKPAVTHYKIIKRSDPYSQLELTPQTGRTHQLRVHLNQLGLPIVGDSFYGGEPADRLYLHAFQLEITLPDRSRRVFTADLPKAFSSKMKQL